MHPEQRLTIREAVNLVAEFGSQPISESALRARAKTKRLGVSRVGNRIYTNPLNLATAGLIPIDVVTSTVLPREIDDSELQAWIADPPGRPSGSSPVEPGPLERLLDDDSPDGASFGTPESAGSPGSPDDSSGDGRSRTESSAAGSSESEDRGRASQRARPEDPLVFGETVDDFLDGFDDPSPEAFGSDGGRRDVGEPPPVSEARVVRCHLRLDRRRDRRRPPLATPVRSGGRRRRLSTRRPGGSLVFVRGIDRTCSAS